MKRRFALNIEVIHDLDVAPFIKEELIMEYEQNEDIYTPYNVEFFDSSLVVLNEDGTVTFTEKSEIYY